MTPRPVSAVEPISLPPLLAGLRRAEFLGKFRLLDALYGPALARHGTCWAPTHPGLPWRLDLANPTHRWIVYGYYEGPAFWRWLLAHRARLHTVVDSGANIGQTTLYFATLLPDVRVLAYEPGRFARAWLEECVAQNHLDRITVSAAALGRARGAAYLQSIGDASTHGSWNRLTSGPEGSTARREGPAPLEDAAQGEAVEVVTLDDELAARGLDRLDLWKLDMEGAEPDALAGAARALASGRIQAIHAEILGESGLALAATLRDYGYRCYIPRGHRLVLAPATLTTAGGNALFLHRDSTLAPP